MKKRNILASLALSLGLAAPAFAGVEPTYDHLECFKARDPHNYAALVDITPQLGNNLGLEPHAGCKISVRSKEFCVPVAKTVVETDAPTIGVVGQDLVPGFLCYKMKCPIEATGTLTVGDQFGVRDIEPSKVSRICTPADW